MTKYPFRRGFLSDNTATVHPAVMDALLQANAGHSIPYGDDSHSDEMRAVFDALFGKKVYPFAVFNGTGANVAALAHLTKRYSAVLCAQCAHIVEDECGAPEHLTGCKMWELPHQQGKLRPETLLPALELLGSQHASQAAVLSLSQLTEYGAAYSVEEVRALADVAHAHGLYVHMDGARLANAVAALGCTVAELTCDAGVDALSFGGTKNGMMFGEAVVFFDEELARTFPFTRKNNAQLMSKSRYIAAQFVAMLQDGLWLRCAAQANRMAARLAEGLSGIPGVEIAYAVDGNQIFAHMPRPMYEALNASYPFAEHGGAFRLVTSFDTEAEDIEGFLALAQKLADQR